MKNLLIQFCLSFGVLLLLLGWLGSMMNSKNWRAITPRGSKWANQASSTVFLIFSGLAWTGLMLFLLYSPVMVQGWQSNHWINTSGVVISSHLEETRLLRTTNALFRPEVRYQFRLHHISYEGDRVDFAGSSPLDRSAVEHDLRTRFTPGAALSVWVNPKNPNESVIQPGVPKKAIIMACLGLALLSLAIWQLRSLLHDWNGDRLVKQRVEPRNGKSKRSNTQRR